MLVLFLLGKHELFHWTHESLYEKTLSDGAPNPAYDAVIDGKKGFLNVPFYLIRMGIAFAGWYILFLILRRLSLEEDSSRRHGSLVEDAQGLHSLCGVLPP